MSAAGVGARPSRPLRGGARLILRPSTHTRQQPSPLSTLLGYASIGVWVWAQVPQLYENHARRSVASLSPAFLALWAGGDVLNLLGSRLTQQLPFQQTLAAYFVAVDVVLVGQYWCYAADAGTGARRRASDAAPRRDADAVQHPVPSAGGHALVEEAAAKEEQEGVGPARPSSQSCTPRRLGLFAGVALVLLAMGMWWRSWMPPKDPQQQQQHPHRHNETLPTSDQAHPEQLEHQLGVVLSWLCTALYLSSRLPQIWWNARRRSVQGLSLPMFGLTATANTLYSSSILVQAWAQTGAGGASYLWRELPFLLGSAGTLAFDAVILAQAWIYARRGGGLYAQLEGAPPAPDAVGGPGWVGPRSAPGVVLGPAGPAG